MSSKIIKSNSLIGTFGVLIMVLGAALFTVGLMSQTIYIAIYGGISTFFFGFFLYLFGMIVTRLDLIVGLLHVIAEQVVPDEEDKGENTKE